MGRKLGCSRNQRTPVAVTVPALTGAPRTRRTCQSPTGVARRIHVTSRPGDRCRMRMAGSERSGLGGGALVQRVYLHSGGISPSVVRAGTGGRKLSQWRTEIVPRPPAAKAASSRACSKCRADKALVARVSAMLKQHGQPPLDSPKPMAKGAPGYQQRLKAAAAARRSDACECARRPTREKATGAAGTRTPKKAKVAGSPAARGRTATRGVAAVQKKLRSTDPYQQMLAYDRMQELEQRKKPGAQPKHREGRR